jgi:acyl-CoA thioester hydrolase
MSWRPSAYRCDIDPQWIDYNGHLRDAYYTLVFSQAIDALMDEAGLDSAYRTATGCTLFTLELHVHYLNEVKSTDAISVSARALGVASKRLHLGLALNTARHAEPVALEECMLLHVQQGPAPRGSAFPPEILRRLEAWHALDAQAPPPALRSRQIQLIRR